MTLLTGSEKTGVRTGDNMIKDYYTYAYLREDGTPVYIGKGKGNRIHNKGSHRYFPPPERRIFLKTGLTNEESQRHEIYMIHVLGRKDKGTGILRNLTDGGEGVSGRKNPPETINRMKSARANAKGRQTGEWKHTPESSRNITLKNLGRHWYNDGTVNKYTYECPEGFVPGRLYKRRIDV